MRFARTTARNRPADELCLAVYPPHDPEYPDIIARGKLGQLLAWEIRRHRDAHPPGGPYRLRVVEVIDWPDEHRHYPRIPRPDLEHLARTVPDAFGAIHRYETLCHLTGGYIPQSGRMP
jgi:hypothetical protein